MRLHLTPLDRVLILAPHPDDESLATGGLILKARQQGAAVRILFATNGDNNPWPQRWVEKRWHVGPHERARWGATRQEEARCAVRHLCQTNEGTSNGSDRDSDSCARFLNLPDQGISRLLLDADEATFDLFCREISDFRPTLCVIPSQHDLHPDHNALHLFWQIALQRLRITPQQLVYLVHCRRPDLVPHPVSLELTPDEQKRKYEAIICHKTQMVLSKKRFIAYARPQERFHLPTPPAVSTEGHRIHHFAAGKNSVHLAVHLPRRHGSASILFAAETVDGQSVRYELRLPRQSASAPLIDLLTGKPLATCAVSVRGREATLELPLPAGREIARAFVKFRRRTLFLDETGWREIPEALLTSAAPMAAPVPMEPCPSSCPTTTPAALSAATSRDASDSAAAIPA